MHIKNTNEIHLLAREIYICIWNWNSLTCWSRFCKNHISSLLRLEIDEEFQVKHKMGRNLEFLHKFEVCFPLQAHKNMFECFRLGGYWDFFYTEHFGPGDLKFVTKVNMRITEGHNSLQNGFKISVILRIRNYSFLCNPMTLQLKIF